jgi:hypothetical protein
MVVDTMVPEAFEGTHDYAGIIAVGEVKQQPRNASSTAMAMKLRGSLSGEHALVSPAPRPN